MAFSEHNIPGLGVMRLSVRRNATRISARWRDGKLLVITPPWARYDDVMRFINDSRPQLLAMRPQPATSYRGGVTLTYDDFAVRLTHRQGDIFETIMHRRPSGEDIRGLFTIQGPFDTMQGDPGLDITIQRMLRNLGRYIVTCHVVPRAAEVARQLRCHVRTFSVGHGRLRMGTCSRDGDISLSQELGLRPRHEQLEVITHELAHLTHFDHSAAFHACHRYLLARAQTLPLFIPPPPSAD